ncbi:sulfotransferase [Nonomuraea diastatica]|uniref:sulfotransferase n=1 Tax=Nonomuraea diastatica TaxID=1848329 RepID=UPI001FED0B7A|nr:sulfotransferase [Nonomuraea diastatica]
MIAHAFGRRFGRTGTRSLKAALELLGYGPGYHMPAVIAEPYQVGQWLDVGDPARWYDSASSTAATTSSGSSNHRRGREDDPGPGAWWSTRTGTTVSLGVPVPEVPYPQVNEPAAVCRKRPRRWSRLILGGR